MGVAADQSPGGARWPHGGSCPLEVVPQGGVDFCHSSTVGFREVNHIAPVRPFDDGSLDGMAAHVLYERRMWEWTRSALDEPFDQGNPHAHGVHNCVVEAFLIHTRILTEFFLAPKTLRSDDVHATDYVASWTQDAHTQCLATALPAINKRIAHISTRRLIDSDDDVRNWSANAPHVIATWSRFLAALPPSRQKWFSDDRLSAGG